MECAISEITGHREGQYRERRKERDAQRGAAAIAQAMLQAQVSFTAALQHGFQ